jgi:hypothetical protein
MASFVARFNNSPAPLEAIWEETCAHLSWDRIEADTAVGAAQDYLAKTRESTIRTLHVSTNFDRLFDYAFDFCRSGVVSPQRFWDIHKIVHSDIKPNNILILHGRLHPFKGNLFVDNALLPAWRRATIEIDVSARARFWILKSFFGALDSTDDRNDLSLAKLQFVFDTELLKYITFRIVFNNLLDHSDAPSTHRWVHTHVLWTGISPPVAVNLVPNLRQSFTVLRHIGGHNVPDYRSNSSRNCGWLLNRGASDGHRECHLQHYSLVARGSQSRGRQRFCRHRFAFERPLCRSRRREVVDQLSHRVRLRA